MSEPSTIPIETASEPLPEATPARNRALVFLGSGVFFFGVVALGIILRGVYFARNRALWLDEAFLALNIVGRDLRGLLDPLSYDQSAPVGYLLAVKAIVAAFGSSEFALRSYSLAAGIVGFFLVAVLASRVLEKPAATFALAVTALSFPLIRYASELKQYSGDAAIAALILLLAIALHDRPQDRWRFVLFAIVGGVSVWFSLPSVFVLAGTGLVLGCVAFRDRDGRRIAFLMGVAVVWVASFAANYMKFLAATRGNTNLSSWWMDSFMPWPPLTPAAAKWLAWTFVSVFEHPLGLVLPGLGVLAFVIGCQTLHRTRTAELYMVVLPLGFALIASALHAYPFTERFLIFAAPGLALVVGSGAYRIAQVCWLNSKLLGAAFVMLLFLQPLLVAANGIADEPYGSVREAVQTLTEHEEPGDALYLYHWSQFEFRYYAGRAGYDASKAQAGITARNEWDYYEAEIEALRGNSRVWFLFVDVAPHLGEGEEQFFLNRLDAVGSRVEHHTWNNARLYLYDLTNR